MSQLICPLCEKTYIYPEPCAHTGKDLIVEIERLQAVMAKMFVMSESLYDSNIRQKIRELLWRESKKYYDRAALEKREVER